jgi:phosphatidylglycerophosphatase A
VNAFILWLAQGFGVGRIPFAPGTFGSLVGLPWFALLLLTGNVWLFAGGTVIGVALAIGCCGAGENILRQKDPGSIVLDEIAAIPICFAGWIGILLTKNGALPSPGYFFSKENWLFTLGVFAAFRFFDIAKPWPVRQSQSLSGGWGVAVDDVLAAIYVSATTLLFHAAQVFWSHRH